MPPEFDFSQGPGKIFVETVHARIINGLLHMTLQSGEELYPFLFPLEVTKKLSRALAQQIQEIEAKNDIEIDGRLPHEPMLSPLQRKEDVEGQV